MSKACTQALMKKIFGTVDNNIDIDIIILLYKHF